MSRAYSLKFILVGDASVGKSQLSRRFSQKDFKSDSAATVGMEFSTRDIPFERCVVKAQIWDTAGQERFESMTKVYYRDALGALLVYDATNRASFDNLKTVWLKQLKEYGHEYIGMVLVGNKVDMEESEFSAHRAVSVDEAREFAEQEGMDFVETSALTCTKVEVAFRRLVLSVARSLPDIKGHLELTGLPAGWIRVTPALPLPPASSPPTSAPSSSSASSSSSSTTTTITTTTAAPAALAAEDSATPDTARSSSRSNSVIAAENAPYCNFWTGAVTAELPTEPADTEMLFVSKRVRGSILDRSKSDDKNLSITITSAPPPKSAGRCFCVLL